MNRIWKYWILAYFISGVAFSFLLNKVVGVSGFSATPYIRMGMVLVIFSGFFLYLLRTGFVISVGRRASSIEFFCWCGLVWFLMGSINFGLYFVTDTIYFIISILTYYFFRSWLIDYDVSFSDLSSAIISICIVLTICQIFLISIGSSSPSNFYLYNFVVFLCLVFSMSSLGKYYWGAILIVSGFAVSFSGLNRAFYLQALVLLFICMLFIVTGRRKFYYYFVVSAFFVLLYFIYNWGLIDLFSGTPLERRIVETQRIFEEGVSSDVSVPMLQRLYELEVVLEAMGSNIWLWLFGKGFGAVIDMRFSLDESVISSQLVSATSTHNIHFLHAAILYRHGIFGFIAYALIIWPSLRYIVEYRKSYGKMSDSGRFVTLFCTLYPVSVVAYSSTASSFFFVDPVIFVCIAIFHQKIPRRRD